MIVRSRPHSLILLFTLRGSILPTIAPRVLLVMALSALVALWGRAAPAHLADLTPAPFTLLGLALSIFLGFHNNACYERWWEALALMRDGIALPPDDAAASRPPHHRFLPRPARPVARRRGIRLPRVPALRRMRDPAAGP